MKLFSKLTLLTLGVSAVPVGIAGYSSLRIGQNALRGAIEENELTVAKQVAEYTAGELNNLLSILRVDAHIFDLTRAGREAPTPQGLLKFLQLVYHQSDDFCAVAMFDERGGAVGQPAFMENPAQYESFRNHEPMRPTDVEAVGLMAPLGEAARGGSGVGPVFLGGPNRLPHVVIAVAFDPSLGGGKRILAAEITLKRLGDYVAAASSPDTDVKLLDSRGRLIAAGSHGGVASLDVVRMPNGKEGELPPADFVGEYEPNERRAIGAFAAAGPSGLGVVVDRSVRAALAPVERIARATLFWIGISVLIGSIVARSVARRIAQRVESLSAGALQLAAGKLDTRIGETSRDELGDLARAFNTMAGSLDSARGQILQQNKEILAWNQTLERRVDEKARELRQAHDLLLRSRSLAAVGDLGSGVAHEINNPLAGVLGMAQLILTDLTADHPMRPMIEDIEEQATRIRKVVFNLLRFAQREMGEDMVAIDVTRVLDDAIELCGPSELASSGVQIMRRYAKHTPLVRGSGTRLQEAFMQLIQNARSAMPKGGTIAIETNVPDDTLVRVTIRDTGRGINPEHLPRIFDPFFTTKGEWAGTGMGLAVVHKTIEDHGGAIQVQSQVGTGTNVSMTFPVNAVRTRLS
ncbi:MAG TPA: ATP-binding protein [Polyangia bacterium]|jgi:signal transduction histidine kinase|nr:ATP-binding protein [Polyangia bacterium]